MSEQTARHSVLVGAIGAAALTVVVITTSTRWIGTVFPGFFVMPNQVIASISLPWWLDTDTARLFQHQVLAVDDIPIGTPEDVYTYVGTQAPGTPVHYRLRAPDGTTDTVATPTRRFGWRDYLLVFVAYFLNGIAFLVVGLGVYFLKPKHPPSQALLVGGVATGLFCLTGADLYGPGWFHRLHIIAESVLGAGLLHFALVFPTDRLGRHRRTVLSVLYGAVLGLVVAYQLVFDTPSAYTTAHLAALATHGLGTVAIVLTVLWGVVTTRSALVRRQSGVVVLGTVAGFVAPGVIMWGSAVLGGTIAVNAAAFTAFIFPLSLGYAVLQQDLFEIDALVRRAVTYATVVVAIAALYFVVIVGAGLLAPGLDLARSPATLAVFNLALLFMLAPLRNQIQDGVDRIFFRQTYDAEYEATELSRRLATVHTFEDIAAQTRTVLEESMHPTFAALCMPDGAGHLRELGVPPDQARTFALPPEIEARATSARALARYEWDDEHGQATPFWRALGADVLVTVGGREAFAGVLVLGAKESGRLYNGRDMAFLETVAGQMTLAVQNAQAFEDLQDAYRQLQENQQGLIQADRLATLGRLTAGIAHEVNTPLAAVLNAFHLLGELGREYTEALGSTDVTPEDHREIAAEITTTAERGDQWARKAAAFIARMKMQGRVSDANETRFAIRSVVEETQTLLAHRVRACGCSVVYEEDSAGLELVGDATRFGQILANLIGNAIDAYEDNGAQDGRVDVSAARVNGTLVLTVADRAGGIPDQVLPRLFEVYTTKQEGRGTGLGLWIARNLAEETFGGSLTVETEVGVGSCFALTVPVRKEHEGPAPDLEHVASPA